MSGEVCVKRLRTFAAAAAFAALGVSVMAAAPSHALEKAPAAVPVCKTCHAGTAGGRQNSAPRASAKATPPISSSAPAFCQDRFRGICTLSLVSLMPTPKPPVALSDRVDAGRLHRGLLWRHADACAGQDAPSISGLPWRHAWGMARIRQRRAVPGNCPQGARQFGKAAAVEHVGNNCNHFAAEFGDLRPQAA